MSSSTQASCYSRFLPAFFWTLVAGAVIAIPLLANNYVIHIANYSLIFLFPALGLNLIFGYTGLLSLAQGAFFGIGAYACALLTIHFALPFWLTFPLAGLICAAIAIPLGFPALRLRAYSFVMCTLGFVFLAETVSKNWVSLTRGDMALTGIERPILGLWNNGSKIQALSNYYVLLVVLAVIGIALFVVVVSSPAGRALRAIRDEETVAASVGVPVFAYKICAFALSAFYAGVGGAAYASYETVISPQIFQLYFTLLFLIIVFGGGAGTVSGVVLGTFVFVSTPELLRVTPDLRLLLYGFVFIFFVFILPEGLGPRLATVAKSLLRRRPS